MRASGMDGTLPPYGQKIEGQGVEENGVFGDQEYPACKIPEKF